MRVRVHSGDLGDDDMRITRVLGLPVSQAACQHRPTGGVQRHPVRTTVEADGALPVVDRVATQQPQFPAGGAMQKREDPDERFMGMDRGIGGPAAKQ